MSKRKRIEYLLVTLAAFVSGGLLYAFVGQMSMKAFQEFGLEINWSAWQNGFMGGCFISCIVSSVILAARFFAKRKLWFKVLAAFLWFPVAGISLAVGMIGFFPYWVYNLVRIIIDKPEEKPEEENG